MSSFTNSHVFRHPACVKDSTWQTSLKKCADSLTWLRTNGAALSGNEAATHDIMIGFDAEMTTIDPENGYLMEIGAVAITPDMKPRASLHIILGLTEDQLDTLSDWSRVHHSIPRAYEGGLSLIDLCRESSVTLEQADETLECFVEAFRGNDSRLLALCGNSVWRDYLFIQKYLPKTKVHIHHRVVDASSAREILRRHCHVAGYHVKPPRPLNAHCAMYDVIDAINYLKWHGSIMFHEHSKSYELETLPVNLHRRMGFEAVIELAKQNSLSNLPFVPGTQYSQGYRSNDCGEYSLRQHNARSRFKGFHSHYTGNMSPIVKTNSTNTSHRIMSR